MSGDAVKVALRGPDGEVETLWANPAGEDRLYVLDNLPWYAYGVSLGDVVEATPDADGYLEMRRVVRKSGNRTLRVILEVTQPDRAWTFESRALIDGLVERGCGFEGANRELVAVNVPPAVDVLTIGAYIDGAGFRFEYADPTYEELYPDEPSGSDSPEV